MDVAAEPGWDIGRGEQVEAELTAFIEKRDEQRRRPRASAGPRKRGRSQRGATPPAGARR
jgi:hypothetical protein